MRLAGIFAFSIALFAPQQSCDLKSPSAIKSDTEAGLRDYFPRVQASVRPEQEMIVAVTCATNLGDKLLAEVMKTMAANPDLQRLRQLRAVRPLGVRSYKYFSVAFEQGMIIYDVDTGRFTTQFTSNPAYKNQFRRDCGLPEE